MYYRLPSPEEAAAAGFEVPDYELDDVDLWPENKAAFDLFLSLRTQWRHGFKGPTGLDYGPLFRLMDDMGLQGDERRWMFDDIRHCESVALKVIHDNQPG